MTVLEEQGDLTSWNALAAIGVQHAHAVANTVEVLGSWAGAI